MPVKNVAKAVAKEVKGGIRRKSTRPVKVVKSYKEPTEADIVDSSTGSARSSGVQAEVFDDQGKPPTRNKKGELVFKDHPEFRPNLTPKQVMQRGSFGGTYFRSIYSSVTGVKYDGAEVIKEFPLDWFEGLNLKKDVLAQNYDIKRNMYKAECGGDLNMWEGNGWIADIDPYGWFMWYCRFFQGRRCSDDERQIARGNGVMGQKGRWRNNLVNKLLARSGSGSEEDMEAALDDHSISPKVRQLLQHWGYRLTLEDLKAAAKRK